MRVKAALSIPREHITRLKYDAFQQFIRGLLINSKLQNMTNVRRGFTAYLQSLGIHPNDDSILTWLQENTGEIIGGFILEADNGKIDFLVTTGTSAELRQIGMKNVKDSDNAQGTSRIRQVDVGQRTSSPKPRRNQEGQQRRPSYYD